jgi:hypothetical protein
VIFLEKNLCKALRARGFSNVSLRALRPKLSKIRRRPLTRAAQADGHARDRRVHDPDQVK